MIFTNTSLETEDYICAEKLLFIALYIDDDLELCG